MNSYGMSDDDILKAQADIDSELAKLGANISSYNDLQAISSEIKELESILRDIPEEDVIERSAFEDRLESVRDLLTRFLAKHLLA